MKITVIGTGYVGLVTGTCFAELGNEVKCVDIDADKVATLNRGEIPIYEPGLAELVQRNRQEGRLSFTTDLAEGIRFGDVVFSAVGTPPDKDHNADLSAVMSVAREFGHRVEKHTVFVQKSTVPVGTNERVHTIILEALLARGFTPAEAEGLFDVVDNPEFLREGAAVKDFLNPSRIVVGVSSDRAAEIMRQLYRPVVRNGHPLVLTDVKSAEIIKYASNAFLAAKISFINEIAQFCERAGGDVREVARGIGLDPRIGSRFLHAGIGYGGSCFPKDVRAFLQTGKEHGYDFKILNAVEEVNEAQKRSLFEKVVSYYGGYAEANGSLAGKTFAVWGLAFKPRTDDLREAPSLTLISLLRGAGARVRAFDPVAMEKARELMEAQDGESEGNGEIDYVESALEALEGADALLIFTEWDEFRGVNLEEVKTKLKEPVIFDGRNLYEPKEMEAAGFTYICIGRAHDQNFTDRRGRVHRVPHVEGIAPEGARAGGDR